MGQPSAYTHSTTLRMKRAREREKEEEEADEFRGYFPKKNYILRKHAYKSTLLNANCNPWFYALIKPNRRRRQRHQRASLSCYRACTWYLTNCFYLLWNCGSEKLQRNTKNYRFQQWALHTVTASHPLALHSLNFRENYKEQKWNIFRSEALRTHDSWAPREPTIPANSAKPWEYFDVSKFVWETSFLWLHRVWIYVKLIRNEVKLV